MKPAILYVEDQPGYFEPFIEALGVQYDLQLAHNFANAVETLSQKVFDLVIIDIMLPHGAPGYREIDGRRIGLQLIHLIRQGGELPNREFKCPRDIPIFVITAVSDQSVEAQLSGLNIPLLSKPFSMKEALEKVAVMVARREGSP